MRDRKRLPDHLVLLKEQADRLLIQNDQLASEYRGTLARVLELVAENAILQTDLRETTEQRDTLATVVRDVEWSGDVASGEAVCPECHATEAEGHREDCALDSALDLIDSFCAICRGRKVVQDPTRGGALKPCPNCVEEDA